MCIRDSNKDIPYFRRNRTDAELREQRKAAKNGFSSEKLLQNMKQLNQKLSQGADEAAAGAAGTAGGFTGGLRNCLLDTSRYNLYIDERQQLFAASVNLDREDNPDIISLSQITGCNLDVDEMRTEEYRTDRDGERESYNPPRYSYSYDYYFYIYLNHPYIHEMKLKLNSMDISEDDRNRRHDVELSLIHIYQCGPSCRRKAAQGKRFAD